MVAVTALQNARAAWHQRVCAAAGSAARASLSRPAIPCRQYSDPAGTGAPRLGVDGPAGHIRVEGAARREHHARAIWVAQRQRGGSHAQRCQGRQQGPERRHRLAWWGVGAEGGEIPVGGSRWGSRGDVRGRRWAPRRASRLAHRRWCLARLSTGILTCRAGPRASTGGPGSGGSGTWATAGCKGAALGGPNGDAEC